MFLAAAGLAGILSFNLVVFNLLLKSAVRALEQNDKNTLHVLEQSDKNTRELLRAGLEPIKEQLSNHVTDTDKKIDKLDRRIDKLDRKMDKLHDLLLKDRKQPL